MYMHYSSFTLLMVLTLALFSYAEPTFSTHVVHEKRHHLPLGWSRTRRHATSLSLPLRFALKQKNIEDIGKYLDDVSHPKSLNYGKHWTAGDVARTFAPTDESIDTVRDWLVASGIHKDRIALSRTKGWINVNVTVGEAERLMNAEYNVYTHSTGEEHVACEEYHLPLHVQSHVDFVHPTVQFNARLTRRSGGSTPSPASVRVSSGLQMTDTVSGTVGELENCDTSIVPICLRTLYGLFYRPVATDKNSYGIVEYSPEAYLPGDLEMFAKNFSSDLVGKEPRLVSIDGGYLQTEYQNFSYNVESDLDLQYAMSLVTGDQPVTLYQTGDMLGNASSNNFLDAIDGSYCTFEGGDDPTIDGVYPDPSPGGYNGTENCGTVKPTYVISTSYGCNEADLTPFYAGRQCTEYAKLGLMGATILYSSGDRGVAGDEGTCLTSNGTQTVDGQIFNPSFPGTCPYVTSVGATMIKPNATVFDPEVACEVKIYSGGGFSNYFAIPEYQKDAVDHYLTQYPPDYPSTIWNSTRKSRAFPDISANGAHYVIAVNGEFKHVYGTSCSSPVAGAIFTMINDARIASGKGPIGFINPIYSAEFSGAFNDITQGNNPGCNTTGFNATAGWDPVTGLGTPNFPRLLELWMSLP